MDSQRAPQLIRRSPVGPHHSVIAGEDKKGTGHKCPDPLDIWLLQKHISPKSDERRKLSVHVVSTAEGGAGRLSPDNDTVIDTRSDRQPIIVTDIVEFKSRRGLYPHPVPFMSVPRKGAHCKL